MIEESMTDIKEQFERIAHAIKMCRIFVPCEMYVPSDVFDALRYTYSKMQRYPDNRKDIEPDAIEIMGVLIVRDEKELDAMKRQGQEFRRTTDDLFRDIVGVFDEFKFKGRI
jgi:hypothetical protein